MTEESRKKPSKAAPMSTISVKRPKKLTQEALAQHLFLGRGSRKVRELFEQGVFALTGVDQSNMTVADLEICRQAYIEHLRAAAAGRLETQSNDEPVDDSRDPDVQLALLRIEQIELAKIKKRKTLGELVERSELRIAVSSVFARVKTVLLKIPKKHAGTLSVMEDEIEVREYLDARIHEALDELASTPVESIGRDIPAHEIEIEDGED
jgi:phage terminase Nu1 subunit (DNA packaging protein)